MMEIERQELNSIELREEAVRLLKTSKLSEWGIARQLGISVRTLRLLLYPVKPTSLKPTFWIGIEIAFGIALVLFVVWVLNRDDVLMGVSLWSCLVLSLLIVWDFIYAIIKRTGRLGIVAPLFVLACFFLGMMAILTFVRMPSGGIPG